MADYEVTSSSVTATGMLDIPSEPGFRAELQKLIASDATELKVDLTGVDSITSVCIGALVAFWVDLNEKQKTLNLDASDTVKKVLDMTGLTSVLMKQ